MKKLSIGLIIFMVILAAGIIVVSQELPKCPKCQQTIYSSWWKYCPVCGAKLPEFLLQGKSVDEEIVLGNIYKNAKWSFRVDKPSDTWIFKTGKDAASINDAAVVVMTDRNAYSMIIPEDMPNMTLKDYENLVTPKLTNKQLVARKEISSNGVPGIMDEFDGDFENGQITWKMSVFKNGDNFYQVHCWALKQVFNKYRKECDLITQSFKIKGVEAGH